MATSSKKLIDISKKNVNLQYPILGTDIDLKVLRKNYRYALIAIGHIKSPKIRMKLYQLLKDLDFTLPIIISKNSYVSKNAEIGEGSIIGAHSMVSKDVIPFSLIVGQRASLAGVNLIGLKRRGHKKENLQKLQKLFTQLFDKEKKENFIERVNLLVKDPDNNCSEIVKVLSFIKSDSVRSFVTPIE